MNPTRRYVREMDAAVEMVRDAVLDPTEKSVAGARSAVYNSLLPQDRKSALYRILEAAKRGG